MFHRDWLSLHGYQWPLSRIVEVQFYLAVILTSQPEAEQTVATKNKKR